MHDQFELVASKAPLLSASALSTLIFNPHDGLAPEDCQLLRIIDVYQNLPGS